MPVLSTLRRSRRLSKQEPAEGWAYEWEDANLLYPSDFDQPSTSSTSSPASPSDTYVPALSPSAQSSTSSSPSSSPLSPAYVARGSSHSRKRKEGHIPRPPNAFMIFRSWFWQKQKVTSTVERDHRHISRIAGICWNNMPLDEREPFKKMADEAKAAHCRKYPSYKYSPVYSRARPQKRKVKRDGLDDERRCQKLASLLMSGVEGPRLEEVVRDMDETVKTEEDDIDFSTPSSSRRPRSHRPRPKKQQRPFVKLEEHRTPELSFPESSSDLNDGFVPTEAIPLLDLSAPPVAECKDEIKEEGLIDGIPQLQVDYGLVYDVAGPSWYTMPPESATFHYELEVPSSAPTPFDSQGVVDTNGRYDFDHFAAFIQDPFSDAAAAPLSSSPSSSSSSPSPSVDYLLDLWFETEAGL
ncbi:hypothetical protein JAAARDRAFT_196285 [Jaapia argillacea MUCL 33604]|uniref:HMG box domain-containing protein n=1 Tax=Jaapia argillacea MUCL 33604 TaxID=933084 RepID=A0A067PUD1_9AGAM|nr:hypothetical protein JAAARDRAFT_196285 [Jaapia argillacea MUCL 33604]